MNRANCVVGFLLTAGGLVVGLPGQDGSTAQDPQADPVERIVASIRAAEQALGSLRLELVTEGAFPSGLRFATSGSLHVLRGEHPASRTSVRFRFADDLESQMESARTADGITIYQRDPAFGEVYVRVPPVVVADLEWAGSVLDRADLPGMQDARAEAPLGSAMLEDLRRQFDLEPKPEKMRGEDAGVWLAGDRRPGLGDAADDLPLADRVELFVRDKDHALLEVVHYQGEKVLQHIDVKSLEVDVAIEPETFVVDGHGQVLREVAQHIPLWSQIENVIGRAEARMTPDDLADGQLPPPESLRPSRR